MSFKVSKIIFYISILSIFACMRSYAAEIFLLQEEKGDMVSISIMLDTEGENINATAGTLVFDSEYLPNPTIYNKKSVISYWIESPYLNKDIDQSISWAGIVPGGFSGVRSGLYKGTKPGELFKIIFPKTKYGTTTIKIKDLDLRINDGLATPVPISDKSFNVLIKETSTKSTDSVNIYSESK